VSRPVSVLMEACVTGVREAVESVAQGALRLELCRDLSAGGLTPDLEVARAVCGSVSVPVLAMLRSAPGPFLASRAQVDEMSRKIDDLRGIGVAGLVLGFLDQENEVDRGVLSELCAAASASGLPVTFHRAFDETSDPDAALETLVEAGVARVLTAGGRGSAWAGRDTLARLVTRAGERVTMVAGGGVRGDHVRELVAVTGIREVHARASAMGGLARALARSRP
jgi:copper homeostasis protein